MQFGVIKDNIPSEYSRSSKEYMGSDLPKSVFIKRYDWDKFIDKNVKNEKYGKYVFLRMLDRDVFRVGPIEKMGKVIAAYDHNYPEELLYDPKYFDAKKIFKLKTSKFDEAVNNILEEQKMPRALYRSELRDYFSGNDYYELSDIWGMNKQVTVQADNGNWYEAQYEAGTPSRAARIKLKKVKK